MSQSRGRASNVPNQIQPRSSAALQKPDVSAEAIEVPRRPGAGQEGRLWLGSKITNQRPKTIVHNQGTLQQTIEYVFLCEDGTRVNAAAVSGYDTGYRLNVSTRGDPTKGNALLAAGPTNARYTKTAYLLGEWKSHAQVGWQDASKRYSSGYPSA